MVYLTRRYRFSAAHRLHSDILSAEENQSLYGKCNNPFGHGHNYVLEVTVAGPVDPATGMVFDLASLDGAVRSEILDRFEHANLNFDLNSFATKVPTTENLCIEIYSLLRPKIGMSSTGVARLAKVRVEETNSNSFEYDGT